ncbi:RT0821/Lpp0805 family surface protein [Roseateles koreensis]|uniref:RT0821/Lpp0805 family surface protein n=1 Tax=Roseateles koreensis TaxID=2987526 RepID=A0ABT5KQS0_9BURK|nr:RT0821/Lpp0805 family surface protein [Roseateles koreensis]MDC8785261.1 RT0821/Lpp0805 family surface protein [Roseateles koreensis]
MLRHSEPLPITGAIIKAVTLRPSIVRHALLCASLCGSVLTAQAAGEVRILKNTVITRFNAEDQTLMLNTINSALLSDAKDDAPPFTWKNDKTRASGAVTALERYEDKGRHCRKVLIRNEWGKRMDQGVYRFCEVKAGAPWKLIGPDLDN